jgi:hypothetical protein
MPCAARLQVEEGLRYFGYGKMHERELVYQDFIQGLD